MSDVELLERAIDRLEDLVAASKPGPWEHPRAVLGIESTTIFGTNGKTSSYVASSHDADLIVALHGTIPALLDLMRCIVEFSEHCGLGEPGERPTQIQSVIDMARAILGESE